MITLDLAKRQVEYAMVVEKRVTDELEGRLLDNSTSCELRDFHVFKYTAVSNTMNEKCTTKLACTHTCATVNPAGGSCDDGCEVALYSAPDSNSIAWHYDSINL